MVADLLPSIHIHNDHSNRYAANAAFITLVAADYGIKTDEGRAWALKQINYMLGACVCSALNTPSPHAPTNRPRLPDPL